MMTTNYGLSLNVMTESQSSTASVSSPMGNSGSNNVTEVVLRPLVSDTALAVLVKGRYLIIIHYVISTKVGYSKIVQPSDLKACTNHNTKL